MTEKIWISWENHRRNQSTSREIGTKLFEITESYPPFIRYPILLFKTFMTVKREKPKTIFVQNPSVVLSLFVVIIGRLTKRCVIVDAHNVGIHFEHSNLLIRLLGQTLNKIVIRNANLTIVTNSNLAKYVELNGGKPFVLPDPFPVFKEYKKINLKGKKNILYICTFFSDEPYIALLEAAKYLENSICIYVSGTYKTKYLPYEIAQNVVLTGYLPEQEYINHLHSVDMVVDLTYREDCLVCGGYEAIAAEKPLLLSDKSILKEYFLDAALYTDNTPLDISYKIKEVIKNAPVLTEKVKRLKRKRTEDWIIRKKNLEKLMSMI